MTKNLFLTAGAAVPAVRPGTGLLVALALAPVGVDPSTGATPQQGSHSLDPPV